jgi:CheY-like chemotaxis protein
MRAETRFWRPPDPQLDDLVPMLAHELRTPLNAILCWAELLRSGTPSADDLRSGLDVICRQTRLQASLVNDLMDIWDLRAGRAALERRPIRLDALLERALRLSTDTRHPQTTLDIERDEHGFVVSADRTRLEHAIVRAVAVASSLTPPGGALSVLLQGAPGSARLEFVPRHPSGSRPEPGERTAIARRTNGISLMLVRQIIEHHGGVTEVDGEAGRPSLEIVLPLSAERPAEIDDAPAAPCPGLAQVRGLRVLVVDDDTDAREACGAALTRYGARVTTASSASEALALLDTTETDVLIADIMMPGEDGFELLRRIRTSPSAAIARMPAAALTACSRFEDRLQIAEAGFELHLTKPVDPLALADAIGSLWESHRR